MSLTGADLSVVVITPDAFDTVRRTVRALAAQEVRNRIEIVLVAPPRAFPPPDEPDLRGFHGVRKVEVPSLQSSACARALGVRAATAPVVAFVEDHAFPSAGWASALIERHRESWAAVAPSVINGNPGSLISWANLVIEYGPWLHPVAGGPTSHLPGHNGSYKRDVLLAYGDRLEAMIEAETVLHWDLRMQGHKLYLEPAARMAHVNFSDPWTWIPLRFNGGRLFAACRGRSWSVFRRALYAAAAPLIPLVRLARTVRDLLRPGRPRRLLPRLFLPLAVGLAIDGLGEMVGYAFGMGNAMRVLTDMEFDRRRHLNARDRRAVGL
jgi:glycosyl transferase family 2